MREFLYHIAAPVIGSILLSFVVVTFAVAVAWETRHWLVG